MRDHQILFKHLLEKRLEVLVKLSRVHHEVNDCKCLLRRLGRTVESEEGFLFVKVVVPEMFDEHELGQHLGRVDETLNWLLNNS